MVYLLTISRCNVRIRDGGEKTTVSVFKVFHDAKTRLCQLKSAFLFSKEDLTKFLS